MDSTRRYRISELKGKAANRNALPKKLIFLKIGKVLLGVAVVLLISWLACR